MRKGLAAITLDGWHTAVDNVACGAFCHQQIEINSCHKILGFASIFSDLCPQMGSLRAAISLHLVLLFGMMRVPLSFFDKTPTGRVLARFSKDVDVLDTGLPQQLSDTLYCFFEVIPLIHFTRFTRLLKLGSGSSMSHARFSNPPHCCLSLSIVLSAVARPSSNRSTRNEDA